MGAKVKCALIWPTPLSPWLRSELNEPRHSWVHFHIHRNTGIQSEIPFASQLSLFVDFIMLSKIIEYKFESGILLEIPIVSPTQSKKNWTFYKMPFGILQKVQYLIQRTYQPVLKGTTWPRFMGTNLLMYNRLLNCLSTWNIPFLFFYPNWTLTAKIPEKNNFFLKKITLLFLFCENELSVARILDQVVP